eukprot:1663413-Amphidinium_carterae.1
MSATRALCRCGRGTMKGSVEIQNPKKGGWEGNNTWWVPYFGSSHFRPCNLGWCGADVPGGSASGLAAPIRSAFPSIAGVADTSLRRYASPWDGAVAMSLEAQLPDSLPPSGLARHSRQQVLLAPLAAIPCPRVASQ